MKVELHTDAETDLVWAASITLPSGRRVDVLDTGTIAVAEPLQAEHGVSGIPLRSGL